MKPLEGLRAKFVGPIDYRGLIGHEFHCDSTTGTRPFLDLSCVGSLRKKHRHPHVQQGFVEWPESQGYSFVSAASLGLGLHDFHVVTIRGLSPRLNPLGFEDDL